MPARGAILDLPPEILEIICGYVFDPYDLEVEDWAHYEFDKACRKSRALMFLLDDGRIYDNYRRLAVSSTNVIQRRSDSILFTCKALLDIARRARQQRFSGILHINRSPVGDFNLPGRFREYCVRVLSSSADANLRARVRLIRYQVEYRRGDLKLMADVFPNLSTFELQQRAIITNYLSGGYLQRIFRRQQYVTRDDMLSNMPDLHWQPGLEKFALDLRESERAGHARISCYWYTEIRFGPGTWARTIACLWRATDGGFTQVRSTDVTANNFQRGRIQARLWEVETKGLEAFVQKPLQGHMGYFNRVLAGS